MSGLMFPKPGRRVRLPPKRMTTKTPLKRKTRMPAKRAKPRRGPWRSPDHRAQVRKLPCCAPNAPRGCNGRMTASHLDVGEEKGMGMKAGDQACVPHCWKHGADWDLRDGPFRGWTKDERRAYAEEAIHETQVVLGLRSAA